MSITLDCQTLSLRSLKNASPRMLELVHIARRRGDSEQLPLELMFDMLQDEVADLRSENVSLKVDISRLNQRVAFLF